MEWMDGWIDGWMGGSVDACFSPLFAFFLCVLLVTKNRKHGRPDWAALHRRTAKDEGLTCGGLTAGSDGDL